MGDEVLCPRSILNREVVVVGEVSMLVFLFSPWQRRWNYV